MEEIQHFYLNCVPIKTVIIRKVRNNKLEALKSKRRRKNCFLKIFSISKSLRLKQRHLRYSLKGGTYTRMGRPQVQIPKNPNKWWILNIVNLSEKKEK